MAEDKYLTVLLSSKDIDRIFSKISIDPETGCWNWTGKIVGRGYGRTILHGRYEYIHRIMYSWKYGPIPRGHGRNIPQLDHIVCNNKCCCNPDHLKLVSAVENNMRGYSTAAINSRKTHCIHGHPLPEMRDKAGRRICKICASAYNKSPKHIESERRWQALNPDKMRAYQKAYHERLKAKHAPPMLSVSEDQA